MSKRLLKILDSALWLIKHFHFKISCLLYDPTGGFHELHIAYKQVEPYMEVSKKVVMPLFESTSNCHQMQLAMKAQYEAMQMCELYSTHGLKGAYWTASSVYLLMLSAMSLTTCL